MNGKPFALVVRLDESEDPAELERPIRQARAQRAVSREAPDSTHPAKPRIGAEIRGARAERKR